MKKLIAFSIFLLLLLLLIVNWITDRLVDTNKELLVHEAKAHFDTMVNTRTWNARHGGVYVKAHDNIKPNPYLKDNTLKSADGDTLIKINPAWMTRQISTIANAAGDYYYKITSLNPINPGNIPDAFEKRALERLEADRNRPYYYEFDESGGSNRYFNFMGALVTQKSCLPCHAVQGYKEGDIRGGIRVSVPSAEVIAANRFIINSQLLFSAFILILFFLFLYTTKRHLRAKHLKEEAERKLIEREKELSRILHNLKGVIYKSKPDDKRTMSFISHEIKNISGYLSNELTGNRNVAFGDLILEADREYVRRKIVEAIEGDGSFEMEYRIRARNGEEKWLWEEGSIVEKESIEGYISDITEKKSAEKEIELTKKRLEQAQQIAHVGSWGMDLKDHTTWWSDEMYKIFHVKPLLFNPTYEAFLNFIHPDDKESVQQAFSEIILKHTQSDIHFRIILHDGQIRYIHAQSEISKEEENIDIVGTMFDITERRIAELKQQEQEQLMIQQSKMAEVGEMVAAIAHQWKQPLNIIGLNAQEVKDAYEYHELDQQHIDTIHDSMMEQIRYMSETIDDFRNFFKPSKDKVEFDLKTAIEEVLRILKAQLDNNKIKTIIQEESANTHIFGRKNELKQVLLIMVNNAKDAIKTLRETDKGFEGEIRFIISEENGHPLLCIRDNGGGIDERVLANLFTPYLTTKGEKGTGIGLKLANTIIENNFGGSIHARNIEGGAQFEIRVTASR